jgi:predicted NBD/HSP70 family sugar kinase
VLALDVDHDGVHTRAADLSGAVFDDHDHPPVAAGDVAAMVRRIRAAVRRSLRIGTVQHGVLRSVALSVANAVNPETAEILALPNTPFPEGLLRPAKIFADLVSAPLVVENDINCAALGEHRGGAAHDCADFAYVFIGAGLGMGLYVGGRLVRGAHGLAGEIGYLATATGPTQYSTLVTALAGQGFGRADSSAMDVVAIQHALAATGGPDSDASARQLGAAIGHVIVDTCAVVDPELVLLGGPLGSHPALLTTARTTVLRLSPFPVRVELGSLGEKASLQGALFMALDRARENLLATIT